MALGMARPVVPAASGEIIVRALAVAGLNSGFAFGVPALAGSATGPTGSATSTATSRLAGAVSSGARRCPTGCATTRRSSKVRPRRPPVP